MINEPGGLDGEAEHYPTDPKVLRRLLVDERLAAATARSNTGLANRQIGRLNAEIGRLRRDADEVMRAHRLAVAALRFAAEDTTAFVNILETLLGTEGGPGSLAEPCGAVLTVERQICVDCQPPCMETVATHLCMLRRGHFLVKGKELHRTLAGREFETGETVLADDDE